MWQSRRVQQLPWGLGFLQTLTPVTLLLLQWSPGHTLAQADRNPATLVSLSWKDSLGPPKSQPLALAELLIGKSNIIVITNVRERGV